MTQSIDELRNLFYTTSGAFTLVGTPYKPGINDELDEKLNSGPDTHWLNKPRASGIPRTVGGSPFYQVVASSLLPTSFGLERQKFHDEDYGLEDPNRTTQRAA